MTADLPGGVYNAYGVNVNNGYQNPAAVFTAINALAVNQDVARANFLREIHKRIATRKLDLFLARDPVVAAGALPIRTIALAAGDTLPRANDDEYQTYQAFITNTAAADYTAVRLNNFVV